MPRQTSIQLTGATERQVADLRDAGYGNFSDIVRIAIDRMHRELAYVNGGLSELIAQGRIVAAYNDDGHLAFYPANNAPYDTLSADEVLAKLNV